MGKTARHWGEKMNLKEAAQQALNALEKYQEKGAPFMECDSAVAALRVALSEDAMQQLTDEQQMIERGTKAWADVTDSTAWVEDLRGNEPVTDCHEKEGDKLPPPFAWYDPSNGAVSTDKNDPRFTPLGQLWPLYCAFADIEDTEEQKMLRRKWFGGRDTGHLSFVEAVDATMMKLHEELDRLAGTWKMADDHIPDATKMVEECAYPECLSTNGCEKQCPAFPRSKDDHIPGAGKMVATINETETVEPWPTSREFLQVEPVAWMWRFEHDDGAAFTTKKPEASIRDGVKFVPLYTAPPKRKPLTDEEISRIDDATPFHEDVEWEVRFARAIERAHGIGGEE